MKIVLGVDPGFSVTGFAIIKQDGSRITLLDYGYLKMSSSEHLASRVEVFYNFFLEKLSLWPIQAIALETSFLGKNAQNFLKLGYLRGILYLLASQNKLQLFEFAPSQIKLSITGFGGASKEQVALVLMRIFPGLLTQRKLDITDAIAIALCGVWQKSSSLL